jgi:hypothetical protein
MKRSFIIRIPHQIFLSDNFKKNFIGKHGVLMGNRKGACRLLVDRLDGKKPLGSHRCRWVGNIKMDLQKGGWGVPGLD